MSWWKKVIQTVVGFVAPALVKKYLSPSEVEAKSKEPPTGD